MIDNDYNKYLNNSNDKKDGKYEVKHGEKTVREVFSIWILTNWNIRMIFVTSLLILIIPIMIIIYFFFSFFAQLWTADQTDGFIIEFIVFLVIFLILQFVFIILAIVYFVSVLNLTKSLKELEDVSFNECRNFIIAGLICFILTLLFGITIIISLILVGIALYNSKQILKKLAHDYPIDDLYPLDLNFKKLYKKTKIILEKRAKKLLNLENTL